MCEKRRRGSWGGAVVSAARLDAGRMAERTKATVLKTVSGATRSRVRIPVLPPMFVRPQAQKSSPSIGAFCESLEPEAGDRLREALERELAGGHGVGNG